MEQWQALDGFPLCSWAYALHLLQLVDGLKVLFPVMLKLLFPVSAFKDNPIDALFLAKPNPWCQWMSWHQSRARMRGGRLKGKGKGKGKSSGPTQGQTVQATALGIQCYILEDQNGAQGVLYLPHLATNYSPCWNDGNIYIYIYLFETWLRVWLLSNFRLDLRLGLSSLLLQPVRGCM